MILVSTDKGLCGALNSNLLREATRFEKDKTTFICAGRKGAQFVGRTRRKLAAEFTYRDAPLFGEARAIIKFASDLFAKEEVNRVDVLYTNFVSTLVQKPQIFPLLPVGELKGIVAGVGQRGGAEELLKGGATEFIYEPGVESVMEAIIPHYINFQMYQILLEAKASEQSARMVAMKNATDNANKLVKDLTLEYNKMRQDAITKELLEIASAGMSL